jgi:hypothetical protein
MGRQATTGETTHRIRRRDDFTCQSCRAVGGPQGAAELRVVQLVPAAAGGSRHRANLLTLCDDCGEGLQSGETIGSVSRYISRYRDLVEQVTAGRGAAEGYVACVRALIDTDDGDKWSTYGAAHRELAEGCEEIDAAIDAVRSLPAAEWPASDPLRETHERCLKRWERWLELTRTLLDRTETLVRARRSNTSRCPDCGAGVWLDEEFCRRCGSAVDPQAALEAGFRDCRRELVRFAIDHDA